MAIIPCPSCGQKNRVPVAAGGTPTCPRCKQPLPWLVEAAAGSVDAALKANVPVLVDLWAPWCGPCRMVAPILEQLAVERAGRIKVVKVNVDELPEVSARYGVQGIPTLLLVSDGREIARQVGAAPKAALTRWLDQHLTAPTR
ncbi:MAG TPA: thioredoxin [Acidimicrobiales bacterium]|jgi:thioredoxin 2